MKSLDRICTESHGLVGNLDKLKKIMNEETKDRFHRSAAIGYLDGMVYYFDPDKVNLVFHICCKYGHVTLIEYLVKNYKIDININDNYGILTAASRGHESVFKYLYRLNSQVDILEVFSSACRHGHLNIVKIIPLPKCIPDSLIYEVCRMGHEDILEWLLKRCKNQPNIDNMASEAIRYGQLSIIRFLLRIYPLILDNRINDDMVTASKYGYLDLIIFFRKRGADIHYDNDSAFRSACIRGHLLAAKWLYLSGANLHTLNGFVFNYSTDPYMIEWLYSLLSSTELEQYNSSHTFYRIKSRCRILNSKICLIIFLTCFALSLIALLICIFVLVPVLH